MKTRNLQEQAVFSTFTILEDAQESTEKLPRGVIMRVKGKFAHADKATANDRIYPRKYWEREIANSMESIKRREILMQADHPEKTERGDVKTPSIRKVAGGITNLTILPDGEIVGEAEFVDTEAGRDAAAIVRAGYKLGISSRAKGTFVETELSKDHPLAEYNQDRIGKRVQIVNEDFQFKTFDCVVANSVSGAKIDEFQENEESEMDKLDLVKLTEDEWKQLIESDKVKALVEESVKMAEAKKDELFNAQIRENVTRMTEAFLTSEKFLALFKQPEPPTAPAQEDTSASDANSARLQLLESSIEELKTKNQLLESEAKKAKELVRVNAIVDETLKGKPVFVVETVRKELVGRELTEETAREFVSGRVELVESILKVASATPPAGKGVMMGGDRQSDAAPELIEDTLLKQQMTLLGSL